MCICKHVCICTHTQTHTQRQTDRQTDTHTDTYTHTHTHTHTTHNTHTCTHARTHTHTHPIASSPSPSHICTPVPSHVGGISRGVVEILRDDHKVFDGVRGLRASPWEVLQPSYSTLCGMQFCFYKGVGPASAFLLNSLAVCKSVQETYCRGKIDLTKVQKRPTITGIPDDALVIIPVRISSSLKYLEFLHDFFLSFSRYATDAP